MSDNHKDWIDIPDLAKKLQLRAENILSKWFPNGKKHGNEILVGSLSGESGQSLRINLDTGLWGDFSNSTDRGGDLVSLYAAIKKITNVAAAHVLADEFNIRPKKERALKTNGNGNGSNVIGIYDPFQDKQFGAPTARWTYYKNDRPYFHVCRYDYQRGDEKRSKTYRQVSQRDDGIWVVGFKAAGITKPYPLFSDKITTDTVLIVEGEKACVAARKVCPYDVVTWPCGVANVKNADWSEIYGKKIIIWPDNDKPGWEAARAIQAILKEHCPEINLVDTSNWLDKYDAFDFVQDKKLWNEIKFRKHQELALVINGRGEPRVNEHNVKLVIESNYNGRIWYDEFRCKKMFDNRPVTDWDYFTLLSYFQGELEVHQMTKYVIESGVKSHCTEHRKNPVKEYFENLEWDGQARIKNFMHQAYGTPLTAYSTEASKNFFLALMARVLTPGCKFDQMLVLEGKQGIRKSTSLRELVGAEFYWDCSEPMGSKDFLRGLKGKMIIELSELNSIVKTDNEMVKKTLSCEVDEYVEKYQTENVIIPRTCVFVGTTNESEYLKDVTGNRRFWPIKVTKEVDIEYVKANREQLFAEAVYRLKSGETYWEFKEEESQKEVIQEQEDRLVIDDWVEEISKIINMNQGSEFQMSYIFDKLGLSPDRRTVRESHRAARCLKSLGFKRITKRDGDVTRKVWVKD